MVLTGREKRFLALISLVITLFSVCELGLTRYRITLAKSLEDEIEVGVVLTSERSMADEQDSNLFGEGEPKGEPTDESAAVTKAEKEEEVDEKKPKLNINTATFEELLDLPGIGKVLAQRIIEYRTEKGKFLALDELMEVRGIGEKLLERIKPYLTV